MKNPKLPKSKAKPKATEPCITPSKGGFMVHFPDGNYGWQPSRDFAEASVRRWKLERDVREIMADPANIWAY